MNASDDPLSASPQEGSDYPSHQPSWRIIGAAFITLLVLLLMGTVIVDFLRTARLSSGRDPCANNLRMIGLQCLLYAKDNGGQFPNTLGDVFKRGELEAKYFVCPSSKDTPARGNTLQETAANLVVGGHLSYIYVGRGLTNSAPNTAVVAYEPFSNHDGEGTHVVFADSHVEFVMTAEAEKMVAELEAGHNPPRPRAFQGASPQTAPSTLPDAR